MENKTLDVLVIAGTGDGRQLIEKLLDLNLRLGASVATAFGSQLLNHNDNLTLFEGRLSRDEMITLFASTKVKCIIDASHPYAKEVSENVIYVCKALRIEYIRFERENTCYNEGIIHCVKDYDEAVQLASTFAGNILLTVGSKALDVFTGVLPDFKRRVFARVLPESSVLKKCEDIGLTAQNIIAMKGPFSVEMNQEIIKYCNAEVLVTKDSGQSGGTPEKIKAANLMNIPVILIEKPRIEYPNVTSNMNTVIEYVIKNIGG